MKEVIKLKQHTPIIHFQAGQAGASLRASELKPKIDRFVLKELETIDNDLYENNKNLIEKNFFTDKRPSRYKIHIKTQGPLTNFKFATYMSRRDIANLPEGIVPKSPSPYFGDHLAVKHEHVKLEIFTFDSKLAQFIKEILPYVLVYNNFGTRQSKGFGCFLPEDMTVDNFEKIICKKYKTFWVMDIDGKDPFKVIQNTYQRLKGGTNFPQYHKSELFKYMCEKGIRWEKHKIKAKLKSDHNDIFNLLKYNNNASHNRIADCCKTDNKVEHRYIRALLGLAEHNEYLVNKGNDKSIKKIQILIRHKGGEIERFRSPITFKVIDKRVYLLPEKLDKIFEEEFEFSLRIVMENGSNLGDTHLFTLKTPPQFDLLDFLTISLRSVNNKWTLKECK